MKNNYKFILTLLISALVVVSCEDESTIKLPVWESGVHAYTVIADGSATDFKNGDASIDLSFDMKWKSIDELNVVNKIEIFALFNEAYTDPDGNPRTAMHGGSDGLLVKTLEGGEIGGNSEFKPFSITQDDVFALYSTSTYDYDTGTTVPVFENPLKPERNTTDKKFIPGDSFAIKWILYTEDGRVFDSWNTSVCNEFPEANCELQWAVVCATEIEAPMGDYEITMQDSYGDGWNGASVTVIVDGTATDYTIAAGSSATHVISVPPGTSTLFFEYVSGDWDSEASFQIKSPSGNTIANIAAPPAEGPVKLDLCLE